MKLIVDTRIKHSCICIKSYFMISLLIVHTPHLCHISQSFRLFLLEVLRFLRPLMLRLTLGSSNVGSPFSSTGYSPAPFLDTSFADVSTTVALLGGANGVSPTFLIAAPDCSAFIDSRDGKPTALLKNACWSNVVCKREYVLFVHQ